MAGLTISLGRCGFCDAIASRTSPVVGASGRPARVCKACVSRLWFTGPAPVTARDETIQQLEREVEADPENTHVRLALGDAYAAQQSTQKAIAQYEIVAET